MMNKNDVKFIEGLNEYPKLRDRMEALLNIIDNTVTQQRYKPRTHN